MCLAYVSKLDGQYIIIYQFVLACSVEISETIRVCMFTCDVDCVETETVSENIAESKLNV